MTSKSVSRKKPGLIRRFLRQRTGAAAIEFALVGPVHIALLLGMIETGMVLAKASLLDIGTAAATKQVYVGAATSGVVTRADIKDTVCKYVSRLQPNCVDSLIVELTPITDFTTVPGTSAKCQEAGSDEDIEPTVSFKPGGSSNTMFMRICLTTDILFPGLGAGLQMTRSDNGKFEFVSASAFQNEPF